jgi:hypothetical protein
METLYLVFARHLHGNELPAPPAVLGDSSSEHRVLGGGPFGLLELAANADASDRVENDLEE